MNKHAILAESDTKATANAVESAFRVIYYLVT